MSKGTINAQRIRGRLRQARDIYDEFPRPFWVLVFGSFIDVLGGAIMFPFFTLYITRKFQVGMTEVGIIFGLFSLSSLVGSMIGGALSDRIGRKGMVIFGLVASATTSIFMGVVDDFLMFSGVAVFVGIFVNAGGPARQAMVADLLPEEKRAQGFAIIRVVMNLAVTIGPMIGGLLITQSYLLLFISDAVASMITAVIVYRALPETRPEPQEGEEKPTVAQTFAGYLDVLRDVTFVWFMGASVLMVLVYMQMNSTLAVYLRDTHGIPAQQFGYLLSLNAAIVVLFQFPIMRWIGRYRDVMVMAVGTLLYAIGFGMYGFVTTYAFFIVALVIVTVGEMLVSPVGSAIAARLAPDEMRGRYMAVFGFSWVIPSAVGPLLAGLVMDNADPRWVWYGAGIIGLVAVAAFVSLERWAGRSTWATVDARLDILEMLEEGEITAVEAAGQLEAVQDGSWAALANAAPSSQKRRHLRIRVADPAANTMKIDLRLPVALVNTVLHMGGKLAHELDDLDLGRLEKLLASGAIGENVETVDAGDDEQAEISLE